MPSKVTFAIEKVGFGFYYRFRAIREPITKPVCRVLARLHVKPAHLTLLRVLLMPVFFLVWTAGSHLTAVVLLTISLMLDGLDGDLARDRGIDSDLGGFQDQTADTVMVVVLALSLVRQGLVSGWLGAYYIFITTMSWWLSMIRGTESKKTDWLFKPETTPVIHISRLWVVTSLIYVYAFFKIDIFSAAMVVISVVLTIYAVWDFGSIARGKRRGGPAK